MPTPRIYQNKSLAIGRQIELDATVTNHLVKVLRLSVGAPLVLFNGLGGEYLARISVINRNRCHVLVKNFVELERESPCFIRLLQGICRTDAMAYCIEKAVELGVNEIVPLISQRVKSGQQNGDFWQKKQQHWQRIAIAACQQSGRNRIPVVHPPCSLAKSLSQYSADIKLALIPNTSNKLKFHQPMPQRINLVVGPEAGLSTEEIGLLTTADYQAWGLGPRTLRSETTGPVAIGLLQTYWGDLLAV